MLARAARHRPRHHRRDDAGNDRHRARRRDARALYPDIAILFVTGYVGEAGEADDLIGHELLRKPFTVAASPTRSPPRLARGRSADRAPPQQSEAAE